LLTGQAIDAQKALEYGLVNEVVPREKLLDRAWKIADHIMTQPRITRRLTTQIIRRPWKKRIVDDLDGGFGIQMFAHLSKKKSIHSRSHIASSVAYVKEGKENNIK
jgi:enoyl-CoA hydratase/carnithine racemase